MISENNFMEEQKENITSLIFKTAKVLNSPITEVSIEGDNVDQFNFEKQRHEQLKFRMRNWNFLKKLKKALKKMNKGDYGCCEECGDDISFERLTARPAAELCIYCKEEKEDMEMHSNKWIMKKFNKEQRISI